MLGAEKFKDPLSLKLTLEAIVEKGDDKVCAGMGCVCIHVLAGAWRFLVWEPTVLVIAVAPSVP